jgi:hypothetical protein
VLTRYASGTFAAGPLRAQSSNTLPCVYQVMLRARCASDRDIGLDSSAVIGVGVEFDTGGKIGEGREILCSGRLDRLRTSGERLQARGFQYGDQLMTLTVRLPLALERELDDGVRRTARRAQSP